MKWHANKTILVAALLLAAASYVVAQAPAPQDPAAAGDPLHKAHDSTFIIGNDDVLAVSVWKEAELSRSVPVRSDGKISLPLIGELQASGRTPLQLENDISAKLKNFITAPE